MATEAVSKPRDRALIVTSLAVEYAAVRAHLEDLEERVMPNGTVFEVGSFGSWEVALLETGLGHSAAAPPIVSDAELSDPTLVLSVGIAGGLRDVRVGDVVAASEIYPYEFDPSGPSLRPQTEIALSHALVQRARAEARRDHWLGRLGESGAAPPRRAFVGPVASVDQLALPKLASMARFPRSLHRDALGVELDGSGLLLARYQNSRVRTLAIRGISDLIDQETQADGYNARDVAARHAAAFAFEILAKLAANGISWAVQPVSIPPEPVELRTLHLRSLRIFDDFALEIHPRSPDAGQWTVLLGDNGVGKTTILRALVFALADQRLANSFLQLGGPSAPFLRAGSGEALVDVSLGEERFRARIKRTREDIEELTKLDPEPALPLYAYGCQRGTALGGPAREVEFKPLDDVRSLFDDAGSLIHAETWLQGLRLAALESAGGPAEAFFDAVRDTVVAVLNGVESLEVNKDGVWLAGPNVDRAPLAALSDGYITTAGWLLDLIARWAHRCQRAGVELDRDFCSQMTALVLIDEIDLHLHPLWQVEIISTLRQQFPQLSLVATTHNPLTLLGARDSEIHVLQRDPESGRVVARQRDIPPGTRADQVLTGDWFGLASTVDRDTLELLDEHRELLRQGAPKSDPRRRELEGELRQRLGSFADTATDRIVQSVAAELIPDDFEELTPEDRRLIREKIRRRARERPEVPPRRDGPDRLRARDRPRLVDARAERANDSLSGSALSPPSGTPPGPGPAAPPSADSSTRC